MNTLIENLNLWSERLLQFAWPVFWQSSLLTALVCVLDYSLRKKVRAAIRYSLWLVVLFKLALPPSLALPTGVAWWLRPNAPAPLPPPRPVPATAVIVRVGAPVVPVEIAPTLPSAPSAPVTPPRAPMTAAAWVISVWSAITAGLFLWFTARWRRVARAARNAELLPPGPDQLCAANVFDEARRLAGVRRAVRLRVLDQPISPAVYGWFRPVILLPRSLVVQLSAAQLRSVLLHELVHLRRGDIWVNCAQALLQIVYWWHPLLWFANARIRRVREDAVDDAVMLVLRQDADTYAPTLLEVAKLAFARPPASLGLVGILESRSALRQRIERLVNFKPPRRAGLSVGSLLAIVAFTALAVPMGEAPPRSSKARTSLPQPVSAQRDQPTGAEASKEPVQIEADTLESDLATGIYHFRGSVVVRFGSASMYADSVDFDRSACEIVANHVMLQSTNGMVVMAENYRLRAASINLQIAIRSPESSDSLATLDIVLDRDGGYWLGTNSLDLAELRMTLEIAKIVAGSEPLHVRIHADAGAATASLVQLCDQCRETGITSISVTTGDAPAGPRADATVRNATPDLVWTRGIPPSVEDALRQRFGPQDEPKVTRVIAVLKNLPMAARSEAGRSNSSAGNHVNDQVRYQNAKLTLQKLDKATEGIEVEGLSSVRDGGIRGNSRTNLHMRRFKVDPNAFLQAIKDWNDSPVDFFLSQGVDLRPSTGKSVFWAYYAGLLVHATSQDLDNVQAVIDKLNLAKSPFANPATAEYRDPHFDWRLRDFQTALSNFDSVLTTPWPPGGAASRSSNASANLQTRTVSGDPNGFDRHVRNFQTAVSNFDSAAQATFPAPNPFSRSNLTKRPMTSSRNNDSPTNLQTRVFKVDPNTFYQGLESIGALPIAAGSTMTNQGFEAHGSGPMAGGVKSVSPPPPTAEMVATALRNYFSSLGVDLSATAGKNILWNDRQGTLHVRATAQDLAIIEFAVTVVNRGPQQIDLQVRFAAVAPEDMRAVGLDSLVPNTVVGNSTTNNSSETNTPMVLGILTAPQLRTVLDAMKQRAGVELLNEGEVTTLSGYQAQFQVADVRFISMSHTAAAHTIADSSTSANRTTPPPSASDWPAGPLLPVGPTLDVIPFLQADGNTIQLRLIPSVMEFAGNNESGARVRVRQFNLDATVWDGQTVVLGASMPTDVARTANRIPALADLPKLGRLFRSEGNASRKKHLLIFVTPTLIDPARNRIHAEEP